MKGRGGFGGGNMMQLMQQAKQMQQKMEKIQEELAKKSVEGSAGGGAVKAVVSGKMELLSLTIDPSAIEAGDAEMLQDMVKGAVNDALKKAQELSPSDAKIPYSLSIFYTILFDFTSDLKYKDLSFKEVDKSINLKSNFKDAFTLKEQLVDKYKIF